MAVDTSDFKNGMALKLDGETYVLVEFQHVKPGKGGAFVRTRLKRVRNGSVIERTFRSGEKVDAAFLEKKKLQFLYRNEQENEAVLMDMDSYDQLYIAWDTLGTGAEFLKEESEVTGLAVDDEIITFELPNFAELKIVEAEPGIKGDTVSGSSTKGATVETGANVQVPYHIEAGDVIKIDLRNGSYIERVSRG